MTHKLSLPFDIINYEKIRYDLPKKGKHVYGSFNSTHIILYLPTSCEIAICANVNQSFGRNKIKSKIEKMLDTKWQFATSFISMLKLSNWCRNKGQEHILALSIKRKDFEEILLGKHAIIGSEFVKHDWIQEFDPNSHTGVAKTEGKIKEILKSMPEEDDIKRKGIVIDIQKEKLRIFLEKIVQRVYNITAFVRKQRSVFQAFGTEWVWYFMNWNKESIYGYGNYYFTVPYEQEYEPLNEDFNEKVIGAQVDDDEKEKEKVEAEYVENIEEKVGESEESKKEEKVEKVSKSKEKEENKDKKSSSNKSKK